MTPTPLDKETILVRLNGIEGELVELEKLGKIPFETFAKGDGFKLAQYHLHRALEGVFHIAEGGFPVPDDKMKLGTTQADGMKVTTLDVAGRYADQMGRPDKPGATEQDFRMLAAIVEAPDGPWFFKAVAPIKTMTAHDASFKKFVKSIRK